MPTYTYQCESCLYEYDKFHSMLDDPDTVCPKCSQLVKRLIGKNVGIAFKGNGFYINDSSAPASKPSKKSASSETPKGNASKKNSNLS